MLAKHGIPLPSVRGTGSATISVYDNPAGGHQLRVDMPPADFYSQRQQSHHSPFDTSMSTSSPGTTVPPDHAPMQPELTHPPSEALSSSTWRSPVSESGCQKALPSLPPIDNPPRPSYRAHPGGLDAPEIGIDFVLS